MACVLLRMEVMVENCRWIGLFKVHLSFFTCAATSATLCYAATSPYGRSTVFFGAELHCGHVPWVELSFFVALGRNLTAFTKCDSCGCV